MTYKNKITPLKSSRFGDRVVFTGNLEKNDLSITISDVQLTDEGIYNCYVRNPPDRIQGHGAIQFFVLTECKHDLRNKVFWYFKVKVQNIFSTYVHLQYSILFPILYCTLSYMPSQSPSLFPSAVPPPRDSTIAVAIGASVGGILALLILSMVVVKCIRRHKNQELISDEQKMEEEGKVDGEGGTEEATK